MSEVLVYTVQGLDELIQKVQKPEFLGEPLREFFNQSLLTLKRRIEPETPTDTGRLRSSIASILQVDTSEIPMWAQIGTNLATPPYPIFVEEGTRPHWPPVQPIYDWVWRNRGKFGYITSSGRLKRGNRVMDEVKTLTFFIRRKIARFGTKGHHMFQRGLLTYTFEDMPGLLKKCTDEIERRWAER